MKRAIGFGLLAGLMLVSTGCRSTSNRHPWCGKNDPCPKPVFVAPPPPAPVYQQPPPGAIQQSGGFPVLPPGALVNPPPGAPVNPPPKPPSISNVPPERNDPQWQPREDREPEARRDVPPRIQLYAPEPIDKDTPRPAEDRKPTGQKAFPAIPQFAQVKDNVYAGLRPPLDGLDWLAQNGVQTIVQIRLFGEDDSAVRKEVENRKMRYVAFEVTPVTLTQEKADEFIKLIRDNARTGIFVYDHDSSLAGSMWYLYLRQGEILDDDAARIRAGYLGLQAGRDGQHRDMWLAVQKLLSENSR